MHLLLQPLYMQLWHDHANVMNLTVDTFMSVAVTLSDRLSTANLAVGCDCFHGD